MQTQELFHDDFRDALRHTVKALGGYDTVGSDLWPGKSRKAAGAWLSDCMNPERPAKLDLEEISHIVRMARERGVHTAMHQFADETGYSRPDIAPQVTEQQKLALRRVRLANELLQIANEEAALNRAEGMAQIRAVNSR